MKNTVASKRTNWRILIDQLYVSMRLMNATRLPLTAAAINGPTMRFSGRSIEPWWGVWSIVSKPQ